MTRPYTLSVGGHETKQLYETKSRESLEIRGREVRLRKRLQLELAVALAEPLGKPKGKESVVPYKDPAKRREMDRNWRKNNPGKDKALRSRFEQRNKEKRREKCRAFFARKRGEPLYPDGAQPKATRPMPDTCECCGNSPPEGTSLCFDHCHARSVFRGWLCAKCNTGIGMLGDSLAAVMRAVEYLKRAEPRDGAVTE